jgi:outer membrane immunogenic protein
LVGWSFGGGIEWMLAPNWLLRGEYRYTRYNTWQATFLAGGGGFTPNSDLVNANIVTRTQTALGGLAFKFGP